MKATVLLRNDNIFFNNKQNQNQLGDWFWFTSKPHCKERPNLRQTASGRKQQLGWLVLAPETRQNRPSLDLG